MSPIEMPGPDATPEQVIAFLSHQLQATLQTVRREDEAIAQVSLRMQEEFHREVEEMRQRFHEAVAGYENDAHRYRAMRQHTVKVRHWNISGKGLALDAAIDKQMREANH